MWTNDQDRTRDGAYLILHTKTSTGVVKSDPPWISSWLYGHYRTNIDTASRIESEKQLDNRAREKAPSDWVCVTPNFRSMQPAICQHEWRWELDSPPCVFAQWAALLLLLVSKVVKRVGIDTQVGTQLVGGNSCTTDCFLSQSGIPTEDTTCNRLVVSSVVIASLYVQVKLPDANVLDADSEFSPCLPNTFELVLCVSELSLVECPHGSTHPFETEHWVHPGRVFIYLSVFCWFSDCLVESLFRHVLNTKVWRIREDL